MSSTVSSDPQPAVRTGLGYGLLGLPLAFVALPLYVLWPNHFARAWGVPLAALGLEPGDRVLDLQTNSTTYLETDLAIRAGGFIRAALKK